MDKIINLEHNILCHNPLAEDLDLIKPMTLYEFGDIIGYNKSHSARLANALFMITITSENKEVPVLKRGVRTNRNSLKKTQHPLLIINPDLYYAGSNCGKIKELAKF